MNRESMKAIKKQLGVVLKTALFSAAFILILFSASCRKKESCFDKELYYLHTNDYCTADCPGVLGCDGKTYCNACEAQKVGIRVVDEQQ